MTFYIFCTKYRPNFPENSNDSPNLLNNQREVSFNLSESFFQIPASLNTEEPIIAISNSSDRLQNEINNQSDVFFVPETQYTPLEKEHELLVNVTADQSVLLPSISSVLEASARSALNHRRKSGHFPVPIHQRVADKLEMPSQNPNSPLLNGSKGSDTADLTEDSLLLALNSSVILFDEKMTSTEGINDQKNAENILPCNKNQHTKFSLDFLNTPPLNQPQNAAIKITDFDNIERVPTQVLLQKLGGDDTQLSVDHEISLLSLDDREKSRVFDPLELLPNTPTEPVKEEIMQDVEGHDAIFFPDSFDESNNPFITANQNENVEKNKTLETIDETMESESIKPEEPPKTKSNSSGNLSSFEARLLSSMSTSPGVNPLEYGPKRIVLSARKTGGSKPAPISIKSSSSSTSLNMSRSISNETVSALEPIKKSLGARMKRGQFIKPSLGVQTSFNETASNVTPSKPVASDSSCQEEKYLNHMLRSENKRISMIIAEPRRTPIVGIKTGLSVNSPSLKSKADSVHGTPTRSINTANKSTLIKEASLASYYTDLVPSSPCIKDSPDREAQSTEMSTCQDSPQRPAITLDSASNLHFKENQWVFFRNGSSYLVGAVIAKTSKTRDIWRVKLSNGSEFTVSSHEMCPVAFLRPSDEIYLRNKKPDQVQVCGPFKFKRFSPQNCLMLELQRESVEQSYDCLKLTRVSIEKETFTRIRDRFDRGCIEDSQIRDQIMSLNAGDTTMAEAENSASVAGSKRKRKTVNITESQPSPSVKRMRQQQIFADLKFLITVGDNKEDAALKEKYSRLIESHGGELLANLPTDHEVPVLKTYLLSNGFKRTPKFMTAIIRGVPRLHFNWLEACCNQGCFIDPMSFATFLIEPPSGCKPSGLLFKSKKFFFSGSAKFKNSWVSVIRLLGGTVSNSASSSTIVISEDSDKHEKSLVAEKIVNVDWLFRCIIEKTCL